MDLNPETLCPSCFGGPDHPLPCPRCGYEPASPRAPLLLPLGTRLLGHYRIGRVLGKPGGFGITYLGWDTGLIRRVAIKEYLPRELAGRASDRTTLVPQSGEDGDQFRYGLAQFLTEARTLAQLDHPNIVRVHQVYEANGTAYLVMDYYEGLSLAEYLDQQGGRIAEEHAKQLLLPILDGLRALHAKGFLHRDVKPQNIYLARTEGGGVRPILMDFGTARQVMGERGRSFSVVLAPGYAPFEQYHRKGKQGPWTDVYGAAAVLYQLVTGVTPPEANERMAEDELQAAAHFGVSPGLSDALAAGLAMAPSARPQTVQAFQTLLGMGATAPAPPSSAAPAPVPPPKPRTNPTPRRTFGQMLGVLLALVLVGVGIGAVLWREAGVKAPSEAERVAKARQEEEAKPQAGAARKPYEPAMVFIPAGRFQMGSPATKPQWGSLATLLEHHPDESPQHWVQIPAFELGQTEVTFAQWDVCVAAGGCSHEPEDEGWGRGERPVINVSWDDAQEYVGWLSRMTGRAYRLPSEAEWEYAARAGTTTPFSTGNCIDTRQANYSGDFFDYNDCGAQTGVFLKKTQPVGSYPANSWGLSDMQGNVWEWVEDCYVDSYQGAPTDGSARAQGSCSARVRRGGAWNNDPSVLRSAVRFRVDPGDRYYSSGFRVARTLTP